MLVSSVREIGRLKWPARICNALSSLTLMYASRTTGSSEKSRPFEFFLSGYSAGGFAIRASGTEIYVANEYMRSFFLPPPSDIVSIIDTSGAAPVASIAVGEQVSTLTFGTNPERAYVAASGHVKVIDPSTRAVVDSIPVAAGYSPAIAYLPSMHRLYLTSYSGNVVTVIDTALASVLTTIPVEGPGYLGVVPDGTPPPPPANDDPKPSLAVPGGRPRRPVVAPRQAIGWIN